MRWFFLIVVGCETAEPTACETLCDELVKTCEYTAFPEYDSCVSGCLFDEERGAKTEAMLECVVGAECDTFVVVECENEFGPTKE